MTDIVSSLMAMGAVFADSSLGEVFNSPFIIPVAGTVMILGIVVAAIWAGVRTREMRSQERMAAIARGVPPDSGWQSAMGRDAFTEAGYPNPGFPLGNGPRNDGAGARRAGLVLCGVGLGLCAFFAALAAVLQVRAVLCGGAAGLIPLAIGIAFLIDGRLRRVEFDRLTGEREQGTSRMSSQGL